jgi:hypothetical protein
MREVLQGVFFPSHVEMFMKKKRNTANNIVNRLIITIYIEKLTSAQFRNLIKEAEAFILFFYEWFLPVDLDYELKIKDKKERFVLGKTMTLDYNTHI